MSALPAGLTPSAAAASGAAGAETRAPSPLVDLADVAKYFDVSAPWLNRVLERQGRKLLHAVDGVSFQIHAGERMMFEPGCRNFQGQVSPLCKYAQRWQRPITT